MPVNLVAEIAKEFISGNTEEVVDIVTFCEAPWGLHVQLLPAQKFILKCFYGLPLDDKDKYIPVPDLTNEHLLYTFTEKEFLRWLHEEGRCNTDSTDGKTFQELVLAIGRRGTKSSLSSYISNYELYKLVKRGDPAKHYGFQPGQQIAILNVAPTDDQSAIVFDMIQSQAMRTPYMKDRNLHSTMTYFDLQTDTDIRLSTPKKKRASLISLAGGCASNSLRGRNAIIVIMDEMAHFIDNKGRFSGSEVYKALTPSIASFRRDGKVISISSPYAKFGAFWDRFNQSFDEPDYTLMFKMYSAMANPQIPMEILKAAKRRDRVGFMCEYGAEFSDTVTAWIDDEPEFRRCITLPSAPARGVPDVQYYMGIDLGFKNDGTSVTIVHKDKTTGKVLLDYANVWFSGSSDVWEFPDSIYHRCGKYRHHELLQMSDIVSEIKELVRWFPLKGGVFDQSNGYALAELLHKQKLTMLEMEHFTDRKNNDVYQLTKRLYAEKLLELYEHPVLVPELLTLEAERKAKNKVLVRAPNRRGAHDDISDALVRAVYTCYKSHKDKPVHMVTGAGGAAAGVTVQKGPVEGRVKQETQKSFMLKKRKMHGAHPRGLDRLKRRAAGAVR